MMTDEEAGKEMQRVKDELDNFNLFVFKSFAILALGILAVVILSALFVGTAKAAGMPTIVAGEQYESEVSVCKTADDAQAVLTADMEQGYFAGLAVFNEKCTSYIAKWKPVREVGRASGSFVWYVHEIEVHEVFVDKLDEWAKNPVPEHVFYITLNPLRRKTA